MVKTVASIDELPPPIGRIKNNQELDKMCNNCILVIGCSFITLVLCSFIAIIIIQIVK